MNGEFGQRSRTMDWRREALLFSQTVEIPVDLEYSVGFAGPNLTVDQELRSLSLVRSASSSCQVKRDHTWYARRKQPSEKDEPVEREAHAIEPGIVGYEGNALNFVTLTDVEIRDRWLELELHTELLT